MTNLKRGVAAILLTGISITAMANNNYFGERPLWDIHPYLGIDVSSMDFALADKRTNMLGVVGGLQFNDYLGLELHWSQSLDKVAVYSTDSANQKVQISDGTNIQSYGIGLTFQADLTQNLYAKSYLGVSRIDADVREMRQDVGVAKLGVGYQFNPDIAAEFTYNYNFSRNDSTNDGVSFQLKYYF